MTNDKWPAGPLTGFQFAIRHSSFSSFYDRRR
jgi:hypothetical protein